MVELILKAKKIKTLPNSYVIFSQDDYQTLQDISRKQIILKNLTQKNITKNLDSSQIIALTDISKECLGLNEQMLNDLNLSEGDSVLVISDVRSPPDSFNAIKKRMQSNKFLTKIEIDAIVSDIINNKYSSLEKASFVFSQYFQEYTMDEIEALTRSIAESGENLDFNGVITDKHSLGGVPGNKVTLLIVPIIAAAGLMMPKTSSRAITSASGTVDTMEALGCKVALKADEIIEITHEIGGLICWGGALNLAPADDLIIRDVEFPLGINPRSMMMASIMAKKKAFGIDMLVLDIPMGHGCKVETYDEAQILSRSFGELGRRLGIQVECGITFGGLPVGHYIGPALEAKEALSALINPKTGSTSLVEKSTSIAGILLEMTGKALRGQGQIKARQILESGQAYQKFCQIIEAQGGNPNIKPDNIEIGEYVYDFIAPSNGWIVDINNEIITDIARKAGAPTDKKAGIHFIRKKDPVKAGETIFKIYSSSEQKLKAAIDVVAKSKPVTIEGMLLGRI